VLDIVAADDQQLPARVDLHGLDNVESAVAAAAYRLRRLEDELERPDREHDQHQHEAEREDRGGRRVVATEQAGEKLHGCPPDRPASSNEVGRARVA
jgi:hypothetical protein